MKHNYVIPSINSDTLNNLLNSCWPYKMNRPTIEEYKRAEIRYKESISKDDSSDYACGIFSFVMRTYLSTLWLHFFYPEQSGKCQGQQRSGDNPI